MGFPSFTSAMATVGPKLVTPKKFIHNIVSNNNYETLFWLLAGRKMSDMLRGGSEVRARVKFASSSQADFYDTSSQSFEPGISQDGTSISAYWHGHMGYDSWREEVMDINSGGDGDDDTIDETWTQEMYNTMQSLYTAIHDSLALTFWRKPDLNNMGTSGAKYPYSIPAYLPEMVGSGGSGSTYYGLFNQGSSGGGQWTAIHGLTVSSYPKYVPYRGLYGGASAANGFTKDNINNLIYHLDMAIRKTKFKAPPVSRNYFDDDKETSIDQSGGVIFSSAKGVSKLAFLYKSSQDRWENWMDPYGQPRYNAIPIVYESLLDTQPLYLAAGGATTTTEDAANITGPRFYGVNAKRMRSYFHKNRFMKLLKPINDRKNPTLWTQYVNSLMTMLCPDRSKHFILSPEFTGN